MRSGANRRPHFTYGHQQNDIHACSMTPYKILEVMNMAVKSMCYITDYTIYNLVITRFNIAFSVFENTLSDTIKISHLLFKEKSGNAFTYYLVNLKI